MLSAAKTVLWKHGHCICLEATASLRKYEALATWNSKRVQLKDAPESTVSPETSCSNEDQNAMCLPCENDPNGANLPTLHSTPPACKNPALWKTQLCWHFENGICARPIHKCMFAHGQDDLRRVPFGESKKDGPSVYLERSCLLRRSIQLGHPRWKTQLCSYFAKGLCRRKREACPFAHGNSELRPCPFNDDITHHGRNMRFDFI